MCFLETNPTLIKEGLDYTFINIKLNIKLHVIQNINFEYTILSLLRQKKKDKVYLPLPIFPIKKYIEKKVQQIEIL